MSCEVVEENFMYGSEVMKTGQEILDSYNNQSEQSFIDGDFTCLDEMIDDELNTLAEQRDDLLAALKEARKEFPSIDSLPKTKTHIRDVVELMDSAIAKASE